MSNELLELVLDEIPDAFRKGPGTAVDKMRTFVQFYQQQVTELADAYRNLPDSLSRPLSERINLLRERADREAGIAVWLRNRLEEIKPGSSNEWERVMGTVLCLKCGKPIPYNQGICPHCGYKEF